MCKMAHTHPILRHQQTSLKPQGKINTRPCHSINHACPQFHKSRKPKRATKPMPYQDKLKWLHSPRHLGEISEKWLRNLCRLVENMIGVVGGLSA